jgi:hypothetical protein
MAILSNNETRGDFTHVLKLTFEDLKTAGTASTFDIGALPAKSFVELCVVDETVPFVGSSTVDITVGSYDTADAVVDLDGYMATVAVDALTVPVFNTGASFTTASGTTNKLLLSGGGSAGAVSVSATKIKVNYIDAAAQSLTAGEVTIGVRILDLSRF